MEEYNDGIDVVVADASHEKYVDTILATIEAAAKVRGTGIARRNPAYVAKKMEEGKAIIALHGEEFAGFCYIEAWSDKHFVANSGLIVVDKFRGHGLAKRIKRTAFELSRKRYPEAKLFGLTTGLAVMKIHRDAVRPEGGSPLNSPRRGACPYGKVISHHKKHGLLGSLPSGEVGGAKNIKQHETKSSLSIQRGIGHLVLREIPE